MGGPYETGRFADVVGVDQVTDHTETAAIVEQMLGDLRTHPTEWENDTLERFLEALAASIRDLPGREANRGEPLPPQPTWKLLAEILVTASGYE